MRAGKLRHRIRLQRPVEIIDRGQPKTLWVDVGNYWAEVTDISSKEIVELKATQGISNHLVTMRYIELTSNHRFIFRGRVYNIAGSPQSDAKNQQVKYSCTSKEGEIPTTTHLIDGSGGVTAGGESA